MRLPTLIAMAFTTALVVAAPVPRKVALPPFPITVGDTRVYEWKTGDRVEVAHTDTVTKAEKQEDGSTHVTVRRVLPDGKPHEMVISVTDTAVSRVSDGGLALAKPAVLLKLPATVGVKWESDGKKYEVLVEEELTVAAGKYTAMKVELAYEGGKTMLWFAPGVGIVRMDYSDGRVLELKSFKPGK